MLSDVVVETVVAEGTLQQLVNHELRWLRTIRALRPVGYALSFITFGVPVATLGMVLAGGAPVTLGLMAVTTYARVMVHLRTREAGARRAAFFLLPVRDLLNVFLWTWSFATRRVRWRGDEFRVARDGSVVSV